MFFSKGAGGAVPLIWFVCVVFLGDRLCRWLFGADASNGLCNLTGEWLTALVILFLGLGALHDKDSRIDPKTGETILIHNEHSFLFIPLIYWSPVFFILGIVVSV